MYHHFFSIHRCHQTGLLATSSGDDSIRVFKENESVMDRVNQPSFDLVASVNRAHGEDVNCVRWNPKDAGLLVSCGDDCDIKLWRYKES